MTEYKQLDELISDYIIHSVEYGKWMDEGEHKKVNHHYDKIVEIFREIQQFKNWILSFDLLMTHENDSVLCWAATHLLPFKPEKAKKILKKLSLENGIVSFDAEMVLDQYEKGEFVPPS